VRHATPLSSEGDSITNPESHPSVPVATKLPLETLQVHHFALTTSHEQVACGKLIEGDWHTRTRQDLKLKALALQVSITKA
jgi:hypothetical protein